MLFFNDLAEEAREVLATKDDDFIRIRKASYDETIQELGDEFQKLSHAELETRRHEHRLRRKNIAAKILYTKDIFTTFCVAFFVAYELWFPLVLLVIFCTVSGFQKLIIFSLTLVLAYVIVTIIMLVLMRKQTRRLIELYSVYGVADALIMLADYRELESVDLSKLPSLDEASGEEA